MATQRLKRIIQLQVQADQFNSEMRKVARSTKNIETGLNRLKRVAVGVFAGAGIAQFARSTIEASDNLRLLQASFSALTGSAERGADIMSRIFQIVEETGVPLQGVSQNIQRLAIGLNAVGATNNQIAAFAEAFLKLGRIGGTNIADLNGALYQISQALASGRLQGDEFRAVMERVPLIAQLIAKELGVGVDQLWEMSKAGKITGDVLFNSVVKNQAAIAEQFETLPATLQQNLARLEVRWILFQNTLAQATGLGEDAADAMRTLGNVLGFLSTVLLQAAIAIQELKLELLSFAQDTSTLAGPAGAPGRIIQAIFGQEGVDAVTAMDEPIARIRDLEQALIDLEGKLISLNSGAQPLSIPIIGGDGEEEAKVQKAIDELNKFGQTLLNQIDPVRKLQEQLKKLEQILELMELGVQFDFNEEEVRAAIDAIQVKISDLAGTTETIGDQLRLSIEGFVTDFTNTIVDGLAEGELAFDDFVKNVLKTIAKLYLNRIFTDLISGIPGLTPTTTSLVATPAPAANIPFGRTAPAGTLMNIGVRRDAFLESTGSGAAPISVVINNNAPVEVEVEERRTRQGIELQVMIERSVQDSMSRGSFDKTLRSNFGVARRAF